jgi:predicted nucleotidyltransferase
VVALTLAVERINAIVRSMPGLELLLLHGSRARGSETSGSDWDFAYAGRAEFDPAMLLAALVAVLDTDRIDLADLEHASGLLRFRAARDGVVVFEAKRGDADRFRLAAAQFWCDAAPVLRRGYDDVLARLDR